MQLISVNIGTARPIANGKTSAVSGIFKEPVAGRTLIGTLGFPKDAICNKRHHGGPDQAIYVYGQPDYDWWAEQLLFPLAPGTFGENLTIADLESSQLAIGDRLHIADAVLELTAPRMPCGTLAKRMDDKQFVQKFRAAERPGVYCRVIQEGAVAAGDAVRLEPYAGDRVNVIEVFREYFAAYHDEARVRRHLTAPLASRAREDNEQYLRAIRSQSF
ncbi:MAG TPA: MOSC domain-containing protein [Tepidisphaeraceae bacterium]|jgi:MOSC domain-containing protein YiiM|nr:MOSC domain-containing protein [Tepidisphaeraceae bacterium]